MRFMKTITFYINNIISATKQSFDKVVLLLLVMLAATALPACDSDDVDNFYTFTGEMMGEYMQARPELYSEFTMLLDTTEVIGLLNAYGEYTCFAPTNEAVMAFYKSQGRTSAKDFPMDTLVKIVYDHIIRGFEVSTDDFVEGRLAQLTMNDRYVSVSFASFSSGDATIRVNKTSSIIETDIEVHNGIIHSVAEVLKPTEKTIVEALAEDPQFTLFNEAFRATDLFKKLLLTEDLTYDPDDDDYELSENNGNEEVIPPSRKYGFTALLESDSTYAANGINNLADMEAYAKVIYDDVYPEDQSITDITNPKNSLNRFVAYHLINKQLGFTKFIIDYDKTDHSIKTYDMFEYIETMCPHTMMEVRTLRTSNQTNLFNYINATGEHIEIVSNNYDNDATNGVYHEINNILTYNREFAGELSSKRLRLEAASFFPEFTNNNMRGSGVVTPWYIPQGYCDRLEISEGTNVFYLNADDRYEDFQGDEIFLRGTYEFTITTPSIPAGTYEVRFAFQPTGGRGRAQLYWDGIPTGIPVDLRINADDPAIGFEVPGTNLSDPLGYENDKMMRNRGFMKGPASYRSVNKVWYPAPTARTSNRSVRKILGIYTFDEPSEHTFKVKAAEYGQFMMDYLEFVPLELIEKEGID